MPFVKVPNFIGKVYMPEDNPDGIKKHNCTDCFSCQMCSDERCELCLKSHSCKNRKDVHNEMKSPYKL
ncbi:MAG: hypothetical protein SVR08_05270 [Spirochaetota bacterium]|nr:hypothetical protein [Spirochaetota bacterium]